MSRKTKITMLSLLVAVSLALSFSAGCALGTQAVYSADLGLEVVEEVWGIIFKDYVDKEKLDASALSEGAIEGMVETLDDPYTSYLNKQSYESSLTHLEGKFEGIGAYVGIQDEQLVIIAPILGSPAVEAGIKAGDVILEVDGSSTSEMSLEEAVLHIRGPEGTSVSLLVLHDGESEPEVIEIVRAEIELSSVQFEMREDIALINISHFSERTDRELIEALKSTANEGATGIIIDLRQNPGGLVDAVVDVASHFLKDGVVIRIVDNQGNEQTMSVTSTSVTTELPMVVLVSGFSASGSEVLAGALQDYNRAAIAGMITFGKGSVNTLRRLKDDSGLYITTARWLTPDGRLIEGKGITPDYEFELDGEDAIQWAMDFLRGNVN